jgi:penicillin-binding protein 2
MSEPTIFFADPNERQGGFIRRTLLLGALTALGTGALAVRFGQLQLVEGGKYRLAAADNQFNFRLVPPPRGRILDRNGVELAGNRPSFRVSVVRDATKDLDETLNLVQTLLPETAGSRRRMVLAINQSPRFVPVPVASDLTWEQFAKVNLYVNDVPGLIADMNEARYYPFGGAFAHVIGYVARATNEYVAETKKKSGSDKVDPLILHPSFRYGKQGVEQALDDDLRGAPGGQKVEVDALGRVVREDPAGNKPPVPGKDVVLTLDADVQTRALEVFGEESGSAVCMDVRNGDVLCMVSSPSFDPNLFVGGMPSKIYAAYRDYERRPLTDKALTGTFAPGSTFKPVTGLAALLRGADPDRVIHCSGGYYLGRRFACHARHGPQTMREAIKNSCNVYFMTIAVEMGGPDPIADVAREFGLGQIFDIGISGQRRGLVPDTEWRRRNPVRGDPRWYPGETPSFSIGQGALTVNCLQLATYTARLANGRKKVTPRLIKSVGGVERPSAETFADLPFPMEYVQVLQDGMNAVTEAGGTGFRNSQLGLGPVRMAGKTGTAQSRNYGAGSRKGTGKPWAQKDHNLFIAYAPIDAPRYAVAVIVQHGGMGGGTAGAPRAREIMKVALLKDPEIRARVERSGLLEAPENPTSHGEPETLPGLETPPEAELPEVERDVIAAVRRTGGPA